MSLPPTVTGLVRMARGPGGLTLGTSLFAQALTLITGIIAARALGVDGRGTLALLWLAPLTLVLLGGIGIPPAITYYIARERSHVRAIVLTAVRITAMLAVGLSVLYGLGLWLLAGDNHDFNLLQGALSVALVPMFLSQNLGIAALLGQQRFWAFNIARLGPVALYAVAALGLFIADEATLTSILIASLGSWILSVLLTWTMISRELPHAEGEPEATREDIVKFGLRGVIGSVSPIDDVRLDQFMVGIVLDARALGLYVAAIAFCNLPRFIASAVGSISYPRIAAAREAAAAWSLTGRYLKIGWLAITAAVATLFVLLPFILPLFFGDEFSEAIDLGRILLVGTYFLSLHRLLTEVARGLGHPGYGSITEAVNGVVFILGVLLVADPITVQGVAWSVLAGGIACSSLLAFLVFRLRGREPGPPAEPLQVPQDPTSVP